MIESELHGFQCSHMLTYVMTCHLVGIDVDVTQKQRRNYISFNFTNQPNTIRQYTEYKVRLHCTQHAGLILNDWIKFILLILCTSNVQEVELERIKFAVFVYVQQQKLSLLMLIS